MYDGVGEKIKALAQVLGWIFLMAGALVFVSSRFLYGFGQLVDDMHAVREREENRNDKNEAVKNELPEL